MRHLRIVGEVSKALKRSGGEAAWPEPSDEFVHQLSDEITEIRRPAPHGGRFRLSFAIVGAAALLLPLAAFADQAGDNLARRDDAVDVELVATDDDDDGGGGDSDSETSVAGAYDDTDDTDDDTDDVGEYDVGETDDQGTESESETDDGAAPAPVAPVDAGGGDDSESDDGAAADQAPLPPLAGTPAPVAPAAGDDDDSEDSDT